MQPISALCIFGYVAAAWMIAWMQGIELSEQAYNACVFAGSLIVGGWCGWCDAKESGMI